MDEANFSGASSVGTDAEVVIQDDLSCIDGIKSHVEEILDRLDKLDEQLKPERKRWWRR